eukprot:gene6284-biopygen8099
MPGAPYTQHGATTLISAGQHASTGRIDAVWVSQDLFDTGWVTKVQHLHDAPIGDHAAVLLELQQPDTPPLGPGRWIFPNDLLGLETALADLKAADLKAAMCLTVGVPAHSHAALFVEAETPASRRQLSRTSGAPAGSLPHGSRPPQHPHVAAMPSAVSSRGVGGCAAEYIVP